MAYLLQHCYVTVEYAPGSGELFCFGNNRFGALGVAGHDNEGPPIVASAPQVRIRLLSARAPWHSGGFRLQLSIQAAYDPIFRFLSGIATATMFKILCYRGIIFFRHKIQVNSCNMLGGICHGIARHSISSMSNSAENIIITHLGSVYSKFLPR